MKCIAVIPARKGSKSIKNKNIIKINNKALIEYTFDTILKSKLSCLDSFVITNDNRVKKLATKYGVNTQYKRPEKTSTSKTSLLETLKDFIKWTESQIINFDDIVILQPTSPLRSYNDLNDSIKKIYKKNFSCLTSLSMSLEHPYESVYLDKKKQMHFFLKKGMKYTRRQDFDHDSYFINGAIYITSKKLINLGKVIDYKKSDFILMEKINSLDLNDQSELKLIKKLL